MSATKPLREITQDERAARENARHRYDQTRSRVQTALAQLRSTRALDQLMATAAAARSVC